MHLAPTDTTLNIYLHMRVLTLIPACGRPYFPFLCPPPNTTNFNLRHVIHCLCSVYTTSTSLRHFRTLSPLLSIFRCCLRRLSAAYLAYYEPVGCWISFSTFINILTDHDTRAVHGNARVVNFFHRGDTICFHPFGFRFSTHRRQWSIMCSGFSVVHNGHIPI